MGFGIFGGQFSDSNEGTFTGNFTIGGNLEVTGTINSSGSGDSEVVDAILTTNFGEAGAGVGGAGFSGVEVDRGSLTNFRFVFDESDDTFKVGLVGSLAKVTLADGTIPFTGNIEMQSGMYVSTGNISSGVASASAFGPLHIRSAASGAVAVNAAANEMVLENSTNAGMTILSGTGSSSVIYMGDSGGNTQCQITYANVNDSLSIWTNNTSAMVIDSSQNVGIQNTSPSEALDVTGNIAVSGTVDGVDVAAHKTAYDAHVADATLHFTEASIVHQNISGAGTNTHAQIDTAITASTNHIADATLHFTEGSIDHGSIAGLSDDDHTIYSLADGTRAFSGNVEMQAGMYVSSGNLSSGVASASAFGRIHSRSAASGASSVNAAADELVLENSTNAGMTILSGTSSSSVIYMGDSAGNTQCQIAYANSTDALAFWTNNAVSMVIDSLGQTGIGITSNLFGPLHVRDAASGATSANAAANELILESSSNAGMTILAGTSSSTSIYMGDSGSNTQCQITYANVNDSLSIWTNNTSAMVIDSSQNVGIQNTSPGEALDVTGNIAVSGTVDGIDIATDVAANTTHLSSNGSDHSYIDQDVTTTGSPEFHTLTLAKSTDFNPNSNTDTALVLQGSYGGGLKFEDTNNAGIWVDTSGGKMHFTAGQTTTFGASGTMVLNGTDLGIGEATPLATLHVNTNDVGTLSISADADDLCVENSTNTGISIISGLTSSSSIYFGDKDNSDSGRIVFDNSADSMRFTSKDVEIMAMYDIATHGAAVAIGDHIESSDCDGKLTLQGDTSYDNEIMTGRARNTSYTGDMVRLSCDRTANSAFNVARWYANQVSDPIFNFSGDGNGTCDGSWTGGGADYAEWEESLDGGAIPNGTSVVYEDSKIRACAEGEDPDGVISANPSVVGNGAELGWNGKYLKTVFGNYDLDENGDRKLNPDYDEETEYVPRSKRAEWNLIGLVGKIPVLKGQVVSSRWKKLKEISETVDLYLVR